MAETITASIAFALLSVVALLCAPLASLHAQSEGHNVQAWIYHWAFNILGYAFIAIAVSILVTPIVRSFL